MSPSDRSSGAPRAEPPGPSGARWPAVATALAACLPAAVLALPCAGPLRTDPYPHLAGAGWIALLALPAAALAAPRARLGAGLALLAAAAAWGALSALLGGASDAVELRRAGVHAAAALALFAAGSTLAGRDPGAAGARALALALPAVSLLAVAGAFLHPELELAGALGNTGALSQAALPGAVAGLVVACAGLLRPGPGARAGALLGALAFAAFAVHAARAPVLLGVLACAGALGLAAALGGRALAGRARLALAAGAALVVLALLAARGASGGAEAAEPAGPGAASEPAGPAGLADDLGGVGVRAGIWRRVPALLADHPLLGFGPGQTQASFPPYRDPREIAASSHGSCEDHATEVDHLHSDPLEGLAELGLPGGLLWLAFLALCAARGLGALRSRAPERVALGAAALALLANALAHSPLLFHPASAALGFALLGAVAGPPARAGRPLAGAAVLALLAAGAWLGLPLIRHGRHLAEAVRGRAEAARAAEAGRAQAALDGALAWRRHEDALAALPRSVPALFLRAEWLRLQGEDPEPALERVLAARPHDARAHQELALARLVRAGDVAAARAHWEAVLALDPAHPKVLRNLATLELEHGEPAAAERHLDALAAAGCLDAAWLEDLFARIALAGRAEDALPLLARADSARGAPEGPAAAAPGPDALIERARAAEAAGRTELAGALESAAHQLWAREHAAQGAWANAVRSYRQALRPTHARHEGGAPLLRLELAAALELRGDREGALAERSELDLAHPAARGLPAWARAALERLR